MQGCRKEGRKEGWFLDVEKIDGSQQGCVLAETQGICSICTKLAVWVTVSTRLDLLSSPPKVQGIDLQISLTITHPLLYALGQRLRQ